MLYLVVVVVELLIFMCVNKLLADTGDPPGMIYPAGYGSGENSPPMAGMGILAVPNFYSGDGSGVAIPDGDLPIVILIGTTARPLGSATEAFGTRPGVVGITVGPLGTTPGVLGTSPRVLGSVSGVVGASSPASPPPWMTKCSTTKVLVKPPASPMPRLS